jgi:hypothetical protein
MLYQLIYYSKVAPSTKHEDVDAIIQTARRGNRTHDITGAILFSPEYFLQLIEGSRRFVNSLYNSILKDSRHTDPIIISYDRVSKRDFAKWDMKFSSSKVQSSEDFFLYTGSREFNPQTLDRDQAKGLLLSLNAVEN